MASNQKVALVTGASSGVGKETARALISKGLRVVGVARNAERLRALKSELGENLETFQGDASLPETAERLLRELRPDLVVLAGGITPRMGRLDELSWSDFSETWNVDLKASFHFVKGALTLPLVSGSTVALLSSGAAINGSHLSGGYAGAKRMQWMMADYAQKVSDERKLGIRFLAVLPKQLIEGTKIAALASTTYGALQGISSAAYMKRFDVPLDAEKVADVIVNGFSGALAPGVTAFGVTGTGAEPLA
jgi:NAD(P)-dependent dehydrogenase (short-subunit alcohol dehydrogenase family)